MQHAPHPPPSPLPLSLFSPLPVASRRKNICLAFVPWGTPNSSHSSRSPRQKYLPLPPLPSFFLAPWGAKLSKTPFEINRPRDGGNGGGRCCSPMPRWWKMTRHRPERGSSKTLVAVSIDPVSSSMKLPAARDGNEEREDKERRIRNGEGETKNQLCVCVCIYG